MAKENISNKKTSKNQIDKNPYMFGVSNDPKLGEIDPLEIRVGRGYINSEFVLNGIPGQRLPGDDDGGTDPSIAALLPQLGDISVFKEEYDYSVTPARVKLTLRIFNRTTFPVVGIKGRVPPA